MYKKAQNLMGSAAEHLPASSWESTTEPCVPEPAWAEAKRIDWDKDMSFAVSSFAFSSVAARMIMIGYKAFNKSICGQIDKSNLKTYR